MRPILIVALGIAPAAFLSYAFPAELLPWRACKLSALDDLPLATVRHDARAIVCTAITHPSQATANARLRQAPYQGLAGEALLLAEAFRTLEQLYSVEELPWSRS